MAEIFGGDRAGAVALELTKRFERVSSGPLETLVAEFAGAETRGEAVILVAGGEAAGAPAEDWQAALAVALAGQPLRAAVDEVATRFRLKRKEVYDAAIALKARQ
jgi:16S rRNA (cytidine1402-2'-O)-methyltransferase